MKPGDNLKKPGEISKPFSDIRPPKGEQPIIHVAVPSAGRPNYKFVESLVNVVGSGMVNGVNIFAGSPVQVARTRLVMQANELCDYLLFIDDDMAFTPEHVLRLVQANKDVVGGICVGRSQPPVIMAFNHNPKTKQYTPRQAILWDRLNKVDGIHLAFTLIKMSVFDKIGQKFSFTEDYNEALEFSDRCRAAGIELWMEPRANIAHVIDFTMTPNPPAAPPMERMPGGMPPRRG